MLSRYQDSLNSMVLSEDSIKKVVKYRVCSMAIHPSESIILVAAGDRCGQIGLWNVVSCLCALHLQSCLLWDGCAWGTAWSILLAGSWFPIPMDSTGSPLYQLKALPPCPATPSPLHTTCACTLGTLLHPPLLLPGADWRTFGKLYFGSCSNE